MIPEIELQDVPQLYDGIDYNDGELCFVDNITTIPRLSRLFRIRFVAFVFALEGNLDVAIDDERYHIDAGDGLFVDVGRVVDVIDKSDDWRCVICAIGTDIGFDFVNKSLFDAAMQIRSHPVIHFTPDEIELQRRYYELARFKIQHPEVGGGRVSARAIVRSYATDLLTSVSRHSAGDVGDNVMRQGDRLYRNFLLALADNTDNRRSVSAFADLLCVTPKYLSTVCVTHAGRTAGELIAMSFANRIKQLLLGTNLSIKEIATQLGFSNLSFFGKYVKHHLGMSPQHYRRHNINPAM